MTEVYKYETKTKDGLNVVVKAVHDDHYDFDMDFESVSERDAFEAKLENQEILCIGIVVSIHSASGLVEGLDSLWNCFLDAADLETQLKSMVDDYGMIDTAENDLFMNLKTIQEKDLGGLK